MLPAGVAVSGAIELAPEDAGVCAAMGLPLTPVARRGEHGASLLTWLNEQPLLAAARGEPGVIWLSGEADSVRVLRDALRARGLERPLVRLKPYWSVRGKAHRKKLERGALAAR